MVAVAQRGQALAEGLVVLLALIGLWLAGLWLARLQNISLQTRHAAAYSAFLSTRTLAPFDTGRVRHQFFTTTSQRWVDTAGLPLLARPNDQVSVRLADLNQPEGAAQAAPDALAVALGRELRTYDAGGVSGIVRVRPVATAAPAGLVYPAIVRRLAVLQGAGHASSDHDAGHRLQQAPLTWGRDAGRSQGIALAVNAAMAQVDAGWSRESFISDWLHAWHERVPDHHVSPVAVTD